MLFRDLDLDTEGVGNPEGLCISNSCPIRNLSIFRLTAPIYHSIPHGRTSCSTYVVYEHF